MRLLLLSLIAASLALALPAHASDMNVSYGPDPQEVLDVCTPDGQGHNRPAVLMIHGGGWSSGNRSGFTHDCASFTKLGVVEVPVDYRLSAGTPDTHWPAQMQDVQLAMRWVRAHAARYGIDPNHICAEGDSAGGQLALMLGVTAAIEPGDRAGALKTVSPRADCVAVISGPSDIVALNQAHPGTTGKMIESSDPARLHAIESDASPLMRVQAGDPPTLLIHGLSDPLVPFAQATSMQEALTRVGTPVWLITHEGGHELKGMTPEQGDKTWQLIRNFVKTRKLPTAPGVLPVEDAVRLAR